MFLSEAAWDEAHGHPIHEFYEDDPWLDRYLQGFCELCGEPIADADLARDASVRAHAACVAQFRAEQDDHYDDYRQQDAACGLDEEEA